MKPLTDKQEGFVQDLIKGCKQNQAYKNNYNAENMTEKTIVEKASKLLAKDNVRARYDELHDKVIQKAEAEGLLSATEVLKKLNELILRNEGKDDKTALNGIIAYGKHHKLFTDKVEHSGNVDITHKSKLISKYLKGD